jgi:hypothetical protein
MQFANGNSLAVECHIISFDGLCGTKKTQNLDPGILKVKLFPHSLTKTTKLWYENAQKKIKIMV